MGMADQPFGSMLVHDLALKRPRVDVDSVGDPKTAEYEMVAEHVRGRVMPLSGADWVGVLGRYPEGTHRVFLEPIEARANYRVERCIRTTALAAEVAAGESVLALASATGLHVGDLVEVGAGEEASRATIIVLEGVIANIEPPLAASAAEGDPVRSLAVYDVLGVEDEAGAGHHLRLVAREVAA